MGQAPVLGMTARPVRVLGVVFCVGIVVVGAGCGDDPPDCSAPFETQRWRSALELRKGYDDVGGVAHRMAERLIECKTLMGRDKGRVKRLLGLPGTLSVLRSTPRYWYYELGEVNNSFESETLIIRFDRNDRVRETLIFTSG